MAVKHYVDAIPPSGGIVYQIETVGGQSKITDVTDYQQEGSTFGAGDINSVGLLECNYSKDGTVHALTTDNDSCENIKFFATEDFVQGDTFTFNGETVTAQTTDGVELLSGFFKANTVVNCYKKGSSLFFPQGSNDASRVQYKSNLSPFKYGNVEEALDGLSSMVKEIITKDFTSWQEIQEIVKSGKAPNVFPVGTQLNVTHSVYGEMLYDVVAHNYFKSVDNEDSPTMTLLSHKVIPGSWQYDAPEAFYTVETELQAGVYNVTLSKYNYNIPQGTYQFTLSNAVLSNRQLGIEYDSASKEMKVVVYTSNLSDEIEQECPLTLGDDGLSLGTFGVNLNDFDRVLDGSNNYKESAIRQILNSSNNMSDVWQPQTQYDRPPALRTRVDGFIKGLDNELVNVIGEVIVPCRADFSYESPDSSTPKKQPYTVSDKIYLLSITEISGVDFTSVGQMGEYWAPDGSSLLPFYEGVSSVDRIKYDKYNSSSEWFTRSPGLDPAGVDVISFNGSTNGSDSAKTITDVAIAFTIV